MLDDGEKRTHYAVILQSLLAGYVRRFNKTYHRRGHLFEGRYKPQTVEPEDL